MRIQTGTVAMQSNRTYKEFQCSRQIFSVKAGILNGTSQSPQTEKEQKTDKENQDNAALGEKSGDLLQNWQERYSAKVAKTTASTKSSTSTDIMTLRQKCIMYILDLLFTRKTGDSYLDQAVDKLTDGKYIADETNGSAAINNVVNSLNTNNAKYVTMSYQNSFYHMETEQTSYQAQGMVVTADGRKLDFNMNINMSRSFEAYYQQTYQVDVIQLCDPLVINLDTTMASVSDQTFTFDLDNDGEEDTIHKLNSGSGYLALDKNDDGVINDGGELFGASSGDGFADLAAYDADGNGWIDEGDPIFNQLKIWVQDESGESHLYKLQDKGVGAIYLGSVSTEFSDKNADNDTNAVIRKTGVFLFENGESGTVQHVDMAKKSQLSS